MVDPFSDALRRIRSTVFSEDGDKDIAKSLHRGYEIFIISSITDFALSSPLNIFINPDRTPLIVSRFAAAAVNVVVVVVVVVGIRSVVLDDGIEDKVTSDEEEEAEEMDVRLNCFNAFWRFRFETLDFHSFMKCVNFSRLNSSPTHCVLITSSISALDIR